MDNVQSDLASKSLPPLYHGRSFFCYRDVNKAIEKHREIYGLRLALKRAVKLENYSLNVEKMKDLNLRLKYGELDYHCFVDTGRPGRPGNDERCPQLVRLKLSPDAQTLIVYESHDHNITPHYEQQIIENVTATKLLSDMSLPNQSFCLKGDITLTPVIPDTNHRATLPVISRINPISKEIMSPVSSTPKGSFLINRKNSFSVIEPLMLTPANHLQSKIDLQENFVTLTPTTSMTASVLQNSNDISADNPEKITLTIKKSECVPNEMVVVGSLRHVEEQKKSTSPNEIQHGKSVQMLQKSVTTVMSTAPRVTSTLVTTPRVISSISSSPSIKTSISASTVGKVSVSTSSGVFASMAPSRGVNISVSNSPGENSSLSNSIGTNTTISNSPGVHSALLTVSGIKNTLPVTINMTTPPLVNIAPKPSGMVYSKHNKPKILCASNRRLMPNSKTATSAPVPKVMPNIDSPESVAKPVYKLLPAFTSNKPLPVTVGKQSENLKIFLDKPKECLPKKLSLSELNVNPLHQSKQAEEAKVPVLKPTTKVKQVTVLKQSPNMKQIIINKPSPKASHVANPDLNKPFSPASEKPPMIKQISIGESSVNVKQVNTKLTQNVRTILPAPKPCGTSSPTLPITATVTDSQLNKSNEKTPIIGKFIEKNSLKSNDIKSKDRPKVVLQRHPVASALNDMVSSQLPVNKIINVPKKFKKKLGRPRPADMSNNCKPDGSTVDTELSYYEKQHIAHGVLIHLLKVTSNLPMNDFTDALDTIEMLTDAFKYHHKVDLTIKHEGEGDVITVNGYTYQDEEIKPEEKDFGVSSTTDNDKLAVTQIDGQLNHIELLKELASLQDVSPGNVEILHRPRHRPEVENMEVDIRNDVLYEPDAHIIDIVAEQIPSVVKSEESFLKRTTNSTGMGCFPSKNLIFPNKTTKRPNIDFDRSCSKKIKQ